MRPMTPQAHLHVLYLLHSLGHRLLLLRLQGVYLLHPAVVA